MASYNQARWLGSTLLLVCVISILYLNHFGDLQVSVKSPVITPQPLEKVAGTARHKTHGHNKVFNFKRGRWEKSTGAGGHNNNHHNTKEYYWEEFAEDEIHSKHGHDVEDYPWDEYRKDESHNKHNNTEMHRWEDSTVNYTFYNNLLHPKRGQDLEVFRFERGQQFKLKAWPLNCSRADQERRLPQALIIGERKCGTSALLVFMSLHPHIQTLGIEVHYFDRFQKFHDLEWYREKMPLSCENDVTIEKSPRYFRDMKVPPSVHSMNPETMLILVVRDPVQRLISDYHYQLRKGLLRKHASLEKLVLTNHGEVNHMSSLILTSMYAKHLEEWLEIFPLNQFFFLDGDQFIKNNPATELIKIEKFLGLEPYIEESMFTFNVTKGYYCLSVPGCLPGAKGHQYPPVSEDLLTKLKTYFKPYNQQFYKLVGHDYGW